MMVAMLTMAMTMNAQNKVSYAKAFTENWSVGVSGGVQTNLHDWNSPQGAFWGIELNKQVTPVWGYTAEVGMGFNNNANWVCDNLYSSSRHGVLSHGGTAVENMYTYLDGRFNITNAFWGYNGTPRLVEVEALAGLGYGYAFDELKIVTPVTYGTVTQTLNSNALLSKVGVNVNFNLGKNKAWTVSVRPAVVWNTAARGMYDCRHAVGQITGGVVYHFKNKSNKKHYITLAEPVVVERVVEKVVEKPVETIVVKEVAAPTTNAIAVKQNTLAVSFAQNSCELTDAAKATLNSIPVDSEVSVVGTTSPEGTVRRNTELAIARANAVADYLTSRGVKVTSAVGGDNGRAAIITIK